MGLHIKTQLKFRKVSFFNSLQFKISTKTSIRTDHIWAFLMEITKLTFANILNQLRNAIIYTKIIRCTKWHSNVRETSCVDDKENSPSGCNKVYIVIKYASNQFVWKRYCILLCVHLTSGCILKCIFFSIPKNRPRCMSKLSKYLIFIFEESEIKHDVSSNLVRLYMNRFIVDEDAKYEICGIHHIEKTNSKVKDIDKIIAMKIDKHERISSKIVSKAAIANDSDVHIITGVPLIHGIPFYYSKIRKLISNKFSKISSYTVLNGYRRQIHSKNYVNHAYKLEKEGKPWVDHEGFKSLTMNPDVDLFFHEISRIVVFYDTVWFPSTQ